MKRVFFIIGVALFTVSLASCGLFSKKSNNRIETVDSSKIYGVKWKIIELYGNPVADKVNDRLPFIQLNKPDSSYSASGGCNGMGGSFEPKVNNTIVFKRGISTMMYCEDMTVEHALGKLFEETVRYEMLESNLIFKVKDKVVARFAVSKS